MYSGGAYALQIRGLWESICVICFVIACVIAQNLVIYYI